MAGKPAAQTPYLQEVFDKLPGVIQVNTGFLGVEASDVVQNNVILHNDLPGDALYVQLGRQCRALIVNGIDRWHKTLFGNELLESALPVFTSTKTTLGFEICSRSSIT